MAEVAKAHGVSQSRGSQKQVLWLRAGYTRGVRVEVLVNATGLGPYNAARRREVSQKAKSEQPR
ncbi:hypothetical protein [Pyrobaculum neutrophilum]|uniref:Uncharacterized protein n=1 Tax=Pyrobaculum neutrophilum (strain DSM 2338 / JCM 9278 / NBRC 100436 / V24Sta) TaxID=444157 RepID=B1YAI2_PYRNV|nr:hypothetical protein [Pyrobaculum neutrophilum]ACB40631.1 hypothetical protein Tneu_1711 [Pyrobaculum neutrophilum V24Sta]